MHHYNSVLSLQITICNDTDGEHNNRATIQSCNGAWVWLIIIRTDLSLHFLHLFSNFIQLVLVLFTPVLLLYLFIFYYIVQYKCVIIIIIIVMLTIYFYCISSVSFLPFIYSITISPVHQPPLLVTPASDSSLQHSTLPLSTPTQTPQKSQTPQTSLTMSPVNTLTSISLSQGIVTLWHNTLLS